MSTPSKVVLVSGGTFGIGRAITLRLARRGHQVAAFGLEAAQVSSIARDAIPSLREELECDGLSAELMEADVSRAADVAKVAERALSRFGRIDAVVNNAAIGPLGTVLDTDEALFDRIIAVNLKGPYLMSRAALPHMIAQGGGSIVNIGSGAGWGKPNMAVYSASKGGVVALSAAMAYDFFHQSIRVNTVIPGGGGIVSGMSLGRVGGDAAHFGKGAPGTAAGRVATGDDIANVVAFLLTPEAETLSGTVIDVGCFAGQGGPIPARQS
ncbi:MAG TPA: SDR family oxidoreductase [Bradyrhizobium sp.]|uniref:SDR family NAD(P)-dependent oxidoreductase n=1 Tax=Bradyrhizobium sp. TaxID=376 RepID=UPI002C6BC1A4|nr:SDR family oxidoreductase [Bradyrhizobium sp.]HLZ02287.1 SDR family oxidoreductase [Bradyrhizobium sp.]